MIREKRGQGEEADTGRALMHLVARWCDQGKYMAAEPQLERAVGILETALGPGHQETQMAQMSLKAVYRRNGKTMMGDNRQLTEGMAKMQIQREKQAQRQAAHAAAVRTRGCVPGKMYNETYYDQIHGGSSEPGESRSNSMEKSPSPSPEAHQARNLSDWTKPTHVMISPHPLSHRISQRGTLVDLETPVKGVPKSRDQTEFMPVAHGFRDPTWPYSTCLKRGNIELSGFSHLDLVKLLVVKVNSPFLAPFLSSSHSRISTGKEWYHE